jgi:SAM-dependent methyltransferase/chromosome segregation ATPase
MGSFHARNGPGDLLARYSFLEPLLEGRRVLEVGAARETEGASALFLAERGAAAVLSVEANDEALAAARKAGHHPFVQFHALQLSTLKAGTFDLILLADGSRLAESPDELANYRRLLGPGGRFVTSIPAGGAGLPDLAGEPPAGDPPRYEPFVNALADHFPLVEVAAQTATVGWVFGLPSEDEPEISMDGSLAGTPDTTTYVAIAGEEPTGLSGFTVVALPVAPLVEAARARFQDGAAAEQAEAMRGMADEALATERARVAELTAALAALEVDRDAARHARETAVAEAEALRAERESAIRARDAARAEADTALAERDHALESQRQREGERETLLRDREVSRSREVEAQRSREVALAEAMVLGESLARAEALAAELSRDRDAAIAARDEAAAQGGELRMALDEARLGSGAVEAQLRQARAELARLAGKAENVEWAAGGGGAPARVRELEEQLEAERASAFELRAALDRAQAAAAARAHELEAAHAARAVAEEERARLEAAFAEHRTGTLESDAALQAARAEVQAARAALEAALDRATHAENRNSELEDAAERVASGGAQGSEHQAAARIRSLDAEVARLARFQEAAARVPALEAEVARLAGLEREPGGAEPVADGARYAELSGELASALARVKQLEEIAGQVPAAEEELVALRTELERVRAGDGPRVLEAEAAREKATEEVEELEAQLAEIAAAREIAEKKLTEVKESADRKVADARRAAYDAAAKAEAARREAEVARKELAEIQGTAAGAADTAREWAQVREALEARVAELQARLEAEEERSGILSAQAAEARAQLESAGQRGPAGEAEERLRAAEARAEDLARRAVSAEARARELDAAAALGVVTIDLADGDEVLREEVAELDSAHAGLEKELAVARNAAEAAEASAAELAAELQAVRWEKDELEQKLQAAGGAGAAAGASATGDVAKLRDELAACMAQLALSRRENERLEAVVASLSVRTELPSQGAEDLQEQLTDALRRAADAETALGGERAGGAGEHGEALRRATQERDAVSAQLAERDGKIARLQREVADKTERLGRLAKELGELKAKGLGKIFR